MHLPKPNDNTRGEIIDPYVKLSLFDKFDKENCKSFKTKCIDDNGLYAFRLSFTKSSQTIAEAYIFGFWKALGPDLSPSVQNCHFNRWLPTNSLLSAAQLRETTQDNQAQKKHGILSKTRLDPGETMMSVKQSNKFEIWSILLPKVIGASF